MRNRSIVGITVAAFISGVAVVAVPPLVSLPLAASYSSFIYDCGIRVGDGVSGGTLSNFQIRGHMIGLCIDSGAADNSVEYPDISVPRFSFMQRLRILALMGVWLPAESPSQG